MEEDLRRDIFAHQRNYLNPPRSNPPGLREVWANTLEDTLRPIELDNFLRDAAQCAPKLLEHPGFWACQRYYDDGCTPLSTDLPPCRRFVSHVFMVHEFLRRPMSNNTSRDISWHAQQLQAIDLAECESREYLEQNAAPAKIAERSVLDWLLKRTSE